MKKVGLILVVFFLGLFANATHDRAGEITFCTDNGLTYYFTVTMYTDPNSCQPDRCELEIKYGDGTSQQIQRVNGNPCPVPASCGTQQNDCDHCGEMISYNVKKNVYTSVHTYSGPGNFTVSVYDQNRNESIQNIPNSGSVAFFIKNELVISPFSGTNCNPVLTFPPIDNGCTLVPYQHNPGAVDPEGDSLVYSLIPCSEDESGPIQGYEYPNLVTSPQGSLTIDPHLGTVIWDYPSQIGEFNICILIEEYRDGFFVGSVIRDMQITINSCNQNLPPVIMNNENVCLEAGEVLREEIIVTDPNNDNITLSSEGEAYNIAVNPALFDSTEGPSPLSAMLTWPTMCNNVRLDPYLFYFKAYDNRGAQGLTDFSNLTVQIVAPAPNNVSATAIGNQIELDWDYNECSNATCYKVYRRIDSIGYVHDTCITGVPAETGYELIKSIDGWNNSNFSDDNNGEGLNYGQRYCYMIVACFEDGSESYPSEEFCAELKREVPILTRVSINTTSTTNGSDTVSWSMPIEINQGQWPGPYHYNIYRENVFVGKTTSAAQLADVDTIFVDSLLNTENVQYNYKIEIVSDNDTIGSSQKASSVFLQSASTDNQLDLTWAEFVPWENEKYVIYKKSKLNNFIVLDTVVQQQYSDTGLINGVEYCYYVKSIGSYSVDKILNPIYNNSQINCNVPIDDVAPCPPFSLQTTANCDTYNTNMNWENPNNKCADDVVGYNVYYATFWGDSLELYDTIRNALNTNYTRIDTNSIAGCYAVTAIDTFFNESIIDTVFCVDNCPEYTLPLVFTPGGDGYNDLFRPFPYRYIKDVDLKIYNRWGVEVFATTDKNVLWDGINQSNNKKCLEGVYYYVGIVNEIRLTGIEPRNIKGYVHLIWEN